jgi:outer membrane biosynthesis protein TonB
MRSYIFSPRRQKKELGLLKKFFKTSMALHAALFISIIISGYLFDLTPKIKLEHIEARLVMKGKERKKKLLPRIVKKKRPKIKAPTKKKATGKANSLKKPEKTEKKPVKKKPVKKKPVKKKEVAKKKEKKEEALSLDELLKDEMADIKKDARAEETDEGTKDGDEAGDVVDPSLAIKGNLYARKVSNIIKSNWKIPGIISPEELKKLRANVFFRITFKGELYSIDVTAGSGNKNFDSSLIEAIKRTGKLPLPGDRKLKKFILTEGLECEFKQGS